MHENVQVQVNCDMIITEEICPYDPRRSKRCDERFFLVKVLTHRCKKLDNVSGSEK